MKFSGITILQAVEFPVFLLIFARALQHCAACDSLSWRFAIFARAVFVVFRRLWCVRVRGVWSHLRYNF